MAASIGPSGTLVGAFWRNMGGQTDVGVETVGLALVYISFGLRIWSRNIQRARYQLNDWLIVVATILMTVRYALEVTVVLKCGVGLHVGEVIETAGPNVITYFLLLLYIIDLLFTTIITLVKLSILHFYTTIFRQQRFRHICYAMMGLCVAFWIATFFATAFFCTPVQKKWFLDAVPGHCGNDIALYLSVAISDFVIDIIIISLPLPILWGLQLPVAKKVALTIVFSLGLGIIIITSVRLKYFLALDPLDITFSIWQAGVLSAIVPLLGIVNANLPVMQPALKKCFGSLKMLSTINKSVNTSSSGTRHFERIPESEIPLNKINASK
ncbi:hypothetical protein F5Y10DRAFT_30950 [Nemania abortiva]|nr:hypothetical protein F5Y10DRAFT_30950 [Nemania abortiva]